MIPTNIPTGKWACYPPAHKRTARQRFIYRAAARYGLISRLKSAGAIVERVDGSFHDAMMKCPLPENADEWNFEPTPEDFFVHLTLCRLDGAALPVPLETFAPTGS